MCWLANCEHGNDPWACVPCHTPCPHGIDRGINFFDRTLCPVCDAGVLKPAVEQACRNREALQTNPAQMRALSAAGRRPKTEPRAGISFHAAPEFSE